jgi:hypothetical protein
MSFRIAQSVLWQAGRWGYQVLLPKQQGPVNGGAFQSLWYGGWWPSMFISVQLNFAVHVPVRAWIAGLIFFLRR